MTDIRATFRDHMRIVFKRIHLPFIVTVLTLSFGYIYLSLLTPQFKAQASVYVAALPKTSSNYYEKVSQNRRTDIATTYSEILQSHNNFREVVKLLNLHQREDLQDYQSGLRKTLDKWLHRYLSKIRSAAEDYMVTLEQRAVERDLIEGSATGWVADLQKIYIKKILPKLEVLALPPPRNPIKETSEQLVSSVLISSIAQTDVIRIQAYDPNPEIAQAIVDKLIKVFLYELLQNQVGEYESRYQTDVMPLETMKEDLNSNKIGFSTIWNSGPVKVVEDAYVEDRPSKPKSRMVYLAILFFSALTSIVLIFVLDAADPTIRSPLDAQRLLSLPLLATVFRVPRPLLSTENFKKNAAISSMTGDLMAHLYTRIAQGIKVIGMVNCTPGEGKSTMVHNLSILLSQVGHLRVLLIDGNNIPSPMTKKLRNEHQWNPEDIGLGEFLLDSTLHEWPEYKVSDRFHLLTMGNLVQQFPATLFGQKIFSQRLEELKNRYDVILFDSPPLSRCAPSVLLSQQMDENILILRESYSRRAVVQDVLRKSDIEKLNLSCVMINQCRRYIPTWLYRML